MSKDKLIKKIEKKKRYFKRFVCNIDFPTTKATCPNCREVESPMIGYNQALEDVIDLINEGYITENPLKGKQIGQAVFGTKDGKIIPVDY